MEPNILKQKKSKHPMSDEYYFEKVLEMQKKLTTIQQAYLVRKERAVVVLEGVDAAGKGGLIRRMTWALDPRGFQVWPISAPSESEKKEHYLQRFWRSLPRKGTMSIFDRSWYGRVLVERIEGFASHDEWSRGYEEINRFEKLLVDDGCKVIKLFLDISNKEQERRFKERLTHPEKRWKLTTEDFRNRDKRQDYEHAFKKMFEKTSTKWAPWHIVRSDNKRWSRIEALRLLVKELSRNVDLEPLPVNPEVYEMAKKVFGKNIVKSF
ncbi:MAG: polyphosphate kinase [Bdellovibrio sp.]|nr:polyphosphate kinase [Bdellovibrio sp.]